MTSALSSSTDCESASTYLYAAFDRFHERFDALKPKIKRTMDFILCSQADSVVRMDRVAERDDRLQGQSLVWFQRRVIS